MPRVDVSKCGGDVKLALKRLKRTCDRCGLPKRMREIERHTKKTTQNRRDKDAAIKRHKKKNCLIST